MSALSSGSVRAQRTVRHTKPVLTSCAFISLTTDALPLTGNCAMPSRRADAANQSARNPTRNHNGSASMWVGVCPSEDPTAGRSAAGRGCRGILRVRKRCHVRMEEKKEQRMNSVELRVFTHGRGGRGDAVAQPPPLWSSPWRTSRSEPRWFCTTRWTESQTRGTRWRE